ncbi:ABZJ_00895 family protein [Psychrobacter sp. AOP7-A1-24]|uniref:ABZJ_00895 family protein n=1 Tax=Psychrobacter sp. AOP7-A1-24 TaxID=3457646 RepID=UPI00402B21C0
MSLQTTSLNKPQTPLQAQPKLARYVGFFAIGYTLASAIFMIIQTKLALNPQLVMVVSIIIGAYIAVSKFIKHQKRALARDEINKLMWGGVIIVWILTVIYFSAIWLWLFDAISREVLFEMAMQRPLPLLSSLMLMLVLTLVSARISLWAVNRLLDPIRRLT